VTRTRIPFAIAVIAGVISGIAGIILQAHTAVGGTFADAVTWTPIKGVLETHFGLIWGVRTLAWVALGGILFLAYRTAELPVLRPATLGATGLAPQRAFPDRRQLTVVLTILAFIAVSPALAGHANAQDPTAVLLPSNVAHVIAISVWIGGLAMLLFVLPAATRLLSLPDRGRLLAATLSRFSTIAGACVAVVLLTGIVQSFVYVRTLDNLLHTTFGQLVLAKVVLFAGVLALGGYNRQFSVPRLNKIAAGGESPGRAGIMLRRALRGEVLTVVAILGLTGALANFAPSTALARSGPYATTESLGPLQIQLTVDPAAVGPNLIHLYLIDAKTGAQWDKAQEFRVELTQPEKSIGPIATTPRKAGPGHYVLQGTVFGVSGDWELRATARFSEFDEYSTSIEVPIN
jgi:copper transport protein